MANQTDHDLLIALDTKITSIQETMKKTISLQEDFMRNCNIRTIQNAEILQGLRTTVYGSNGNKDGLVDKVKENERNVEELEEKHEKIKLALIWLIGILVGSGVIVGGGVGLSHLFG